MSSRLLTNLMIYAVLINAHSDYMLKSYRYMVVWLNYSVYTHLLYLCVGESKVPPVLHSTYSTVQSSACAYSTAVKTTLAGS